MKKEQKIEKTYTLKSYPKRVEMIFELPVRKNKGRYQAWTGEKWVNLALSDIFGADKK